ncbi:hypothetical protein L7F22_013626 [Adiantum nelumboides]|nr:hypothetical protein [Adiantum nelumboides]
MPRADVSTTRTHPARLSPKDEARPAATSTTPDVVVVDPAVAQLRQCLQQNGVKNFTRDHTTRDSLLYFSLQNLRFAEPSELKPAVIVLPQSAEEVQASLKCFLKARQDAKLVGKRPWELRIRSGGHSYEARSSTAQSYFLIIDLMNMNKVVVDPVRSLSPPTAWVGGGATLGEIYYAIAQATSNEYGFPAGICPTVGNGGHFSAGGYGFLARKYGVAADNILDAQIVTADLQIKTSLLQDQDLLWALRGGGGGSWGIVIAWKIQLVRVTPVVTSYRVATTQQNTLANLMFQWQYLASTLAPDELEITVRLTSQGDGKILAEFSGQNLGTINQTLAWFDEHFHDLGMQEGNCKEGNWIEAVATTAHTQNRIDLTNRWFADKNYFKAKSDFVSKKISEEDWNVIIRAFVNKSVNLLGMLSYNRSMFFEPSGGFMWRVPSDKIAYPHRAGNLFSIQYLAAWSIDKSGHFEPDPDLYMAWIRDFYSRTMKPFVSHDNAEEARVAYVAFLDFDLGNSTSVSEASLTWGRSYFLQNFERLVQIKTRVDPKNVFNMPQSIPVARLS